MSTDLSTTGRRTVVPVTLRNKIGLVLAGLLALGDVTSPFTDLSNPSPGEQGPPMPVLAVGAVLGVITLVALVYTWRTGNRVGARVVAGSRILSVMLALPAFFVGGVPAGIVVLVAVIVVITLLTVWLVLARPAEPADPQ